MPVDDIESGLAGPVHFCAAVTAARKAGSVVHFAAAVHNRVLFGKWSGAEVKVDGDDLLIMKESDIMGVVG